MIYMHMTIARALLSRTSEKRLQDIYRRVQNLEILHRQWLKMLSRALLERCEQFNVLNQNLTQTTEPGPILVVVWFKGGRLWRIHFSCERIVVRPVHRIGVVSIVSVGMRPKLPQLRLDASCVRKL